MKYKSSSCDTCEFLEMEGIEGVCNYYHKVIEYIPDKCSKYSPKYKVPIKRSECPWKGLDCAWCGVDCRDE